MSTFKKLIIDLLLIVLIASLIALVILSCEKLSENKKPNNVEIKNLQKNYNLELLAVTPEGTKIYRVLGDKMIVPMFMAESHNGHVAIR
jgi:lipopolysaccharide export system protein LptC